MAYPFRDEQPTTHATWGTWGLLILCAVVFAFAQPKPMQGFTHGLTFAEQSRAELEIIRFQDRWAFVPCEVTHARSIADGAACGGYGFDDPGAYATKNIWTPFITAMFLHVNLIHLLSNLLFLWVFGRGLEQRVGTAGVTGLFLAGGIAAFLGYLMVAPEEAAPLLGASGAIAAIMGAYLVLQPRRRMLSFVYAAGLQVVYLPAWSVLTFFFASQFFTTPDARVAWQAHVAGMVFGLAVGWAWRWRDPTLGDRAAANATIVDAGPVPSGKAAAWPLLPSSPPTARPDNDGINRARDAEPEGGFPPTPDPLGPGHR